MDVERLNNAVIAWRRNQRAGLRAKGIDILDSGRLNAPEPNSMDGVDATPEELIAYLVWSRAQASKLMATFQRASVAGMATGVGGHELHSEMSNVRYALRLMNDRLKDEGAWAARIESANASLRRLEAGIGYRSRFGSPQGGRFATGKNVSEAVTELLGRGLASDKVRVEVTDAFRAAEYLGPFDDVVPVYVNLVRNAWRWTRDAGRERVIRLDAYTVEFPPVDPSVDPNDEDDHSGRPTYETIGVVEDSGIGIPEGLEEEIFRPYRTGGYGGTGLGLYICRKNLEGCGRTTVVDPAGSELGGARFLVGPAKALVPVPGFSLDEVDRLCLEAVAIAGLHLDGRPDLIPRMHADAYADIMAESLRIRIEGPRSPSERLLLQAAEAMQGIIEGRLDASALDPFRDDLLTEGAGPRF